MTVYISPKTNLSIPTKKLAVEMERYILQEKIDNSLSDNGGNAITDSVLPP